jgi:hypothetical protein
MPYCTSVPPHYAPESRQRIHQSLWCGAKVVPQAVQLAAKARQQARLCRENSPLYLVRQITRQLFIAIEPAEPRNSILEKL